jgi:FkbM family methyltransferase
MHISSYLNKRFTSRINGSLIQTVIECGGRDGMDSLALYNHYHPGRIYVFECNPEAIRLCKENLKAHPFIKLVEKAVYNENKIVDFYPTDMEKSVDKNLGSSSMLWHRDNKVEFFQKKIQVEATRLDTFMQKEGLDKISLLCMDVQGVEIEVLEGLGDKINQVQYLITEVAFEHYYEGDHLFNEIRKYLDQKGFNLLIGSGLLGNRKQGLTDCLFKNKKRI